MHGTMAGTGGNTNFGTPDAVDRVEIIHGKMKEFPFIESNTGMNGIVMRNVGFVNGDAFCDVVPCPIWHACMFVNTRYAVVPAIRTSDIWWAGEARGVGFVFAAGSWGKEEEEETKNEHHDRC